MPRRAAEELIMLSSRTILACLALLLAACAMPDDWNPPEPPADEPPGQILSTCQQNLRSGGASADGCEMQGRRILGDVFDEPSYYSVSASAKDGANVDVSVALTGNASLTATPLGGGVGMPYGDTDLRFLHMVFTGTTGGTVEITERGYSGTLSLFKLTYRPVGDPIGFNPCQKEWAIPLAGYFDSRARHRADATKLSFACWEEGVAAKCSDWNFPATALAGSTNWKAHQTCMRAARADYCKNGTTHTLDETYIKLSDTYPTLGFDAPPPIFPGLRNWPPPLNVYKLEAAWPEDDTQPVLCLSKTRWDGLDDDAVAACSTVLKDPRKDRTAFFCEDPRMDLGGATIINESKYTTIALQQWDDGSDLYSTVSGYYPGQQPSPVPVLAPLVDPINRDPSYTPVAKQGILIRSLPGSIGLDEMNQLYTYSDGVDHFIGPAVSITWVPPQGYTAIPVWEGMVFNTITTDNPFDLRMLSLYQSSSGEYLNSSEEMDASYTWVADLGYLPVGEQP
jgi:hypothetical protein